MMADRRLGGDAVTVPFPVRSHGRLSLDEYLSFLDSCAEEERWQLIDGVAFMMPPPTIRHQTIGGNLYFLLRTALRRTRPDLLPIYEAGLIVPGRPYFRPQADIAVVDRTSAEGSWRDRFYLVAEIVSPRNTEEMMQEKRANYIAHPDNLYVLTIAQDRIEIEVSARRTGWERSVLHDPDAVIELPEFGVSCPIRDIYESTPLVQG
jgi:Uma2 family endonuclease